TIIKEQLSLEARHFVDPMTIVATGAAVFASTQKVPAALRAGSRSADAVELSLEFEPMTTDPEPLLVGKLDRAKLPSGGTVRALRGDGGFSSRPAPVDPQGRFAIDLSLRPNVLNNFTLEVTDASGANVRAEPAKLNILHGFSVAKPPLSQSVGVMLANNEVAWYLRRGVPLPARQTT